jgi:hypothetical protein
MPLPLPRLAKALHRSNPGRFCDRPDATSTIPGKGARLETAGGFPARGRPVGRGPRAPSVHGTPGARSPSWQRVYPAHPGLAGAGSRPPARAACLRASVDPGSCPARPMPARSGDGPWRATPSIRRSLSNPAAVAQRGASLIYAHPLGRLRRTHHGPGRWPHTPRAIGPGPAAAASRSLRRPQGIPPLGPTCAGRRARGRTRQHAPRNTPANRA